MTQELTVNGNTVLASSAHSHRWLDAIGPDVCKYVEEFVKVPFTGADAPAGYTTTLIEDGAGESTIALVAGSVGGEILFTSDIADNDGCQSQHLGEAFYFNSAYPTYIGARFKLAETIQCDAALGLVITDTTVLLDGASDGLYFRTDDGAATLYLVAEKDSAETKIGLTTLVANTYVVAEMLYQDGIAKVYINGAEVGQLSDADPNWPDDEYLSPTIALLTGEVTNVKTMTVDWLRIIQIQSV